jgi:hypothetical protein
VTPWERAARNDGRIPLTWFAFLKNKDLNPHDCAWDNPALPELLAEYEQHKLGHRVKMRLLNLKPCTVDELMDEIGQAAAYKPNRS